MRFGITGNTAKEGLWTPVRELIDWFTENGKRFVLFPDLRKGLEKRGLDCGGAMPAADANGFLDQSDVVLSFGGDGTLLNTVHAVGDRPIPILGVNHGRLGFLAHVESSELPQAVADLEAGRYETRARLVLEGSLADSAELHPKWALNEFTVQRSGDSGLLALRVVVDGEDLNTYWADGLIVSTPTGSTAYSLALGGPIMAPGCGGILITPIAPHSLTVRPIVLPEDSVIEVTVMNPEKAHIITADGTTALSNGTRAKHTLSIRKAAHRVQLVRFPQHSYFGTLRSKLMWGASKTP